jgi:hypothetical protein
MTLRVDNVGSMLRPPALVDAVARHEAGELPVEALRTRAAQADQPEDVLAGGDLRAFTGGARPLTDGLRATHRLARLAELWSRERATV